MGYHALVWATEIRNRRDFERWRARSKTRHRYLLISFLTGAFLGFGIAIFGMIFGVQPSNSYSALGNFGIALLAVLMSGFCCVGPLVYIPCWLMLCRGLDNYRLVIRKLLNENRVCLVCHKVSLFEDKYIEPSKGKRHNKADLVPKMNLIKEAGVTHILCDNCLAEVNATDSNSAV